jgi:hypothetical protein
MEKFRGKGKLKRSIAKRPSREAQECWDHSIDTQLSNKEKALLAEKLFSHVWCTQGKGAAMQHVWSPKKLLDVADENFDLGCQRLLYKQYPPALLLLKKSLHLYEMYQSPPNASIATHKNFLEQKAKTHYALGLVQMGMYKIDCAEGNFYHSWKVSASNPDLALLTEYAQCMMEKVLTSKWGKLEAHCRMICIQNSVAHELEADGMYAKGHLRQSLHEYRKCFFHEEHESYLRLTQAHIHCKMAMLYQTLDLLKLAEEEWTMALNTYQHELGADHSRTIATMKRLTANKRNHNTNPTATRKGKRKRSMLETIFFTYK